MSDAEVQKPRKDRDEHETKAAIIALSGFVLSVFFILWALIILVRFYIFDSIFYNLFLVCMMVTGIAFNVASINLMLTEVTSDSSIILFILGAPVTIFWTILTIILPIFKKNFYSQFSTMPIAIYDSSFYDGLAYEPNNTKIHPFAKRYNTGTSFFDNSFLILILMVFFAIAQLIFWMYSIAFYMKLKQEARHMAKQDIQSCSKTL